MVRSLGGHSLLLQCGTRENVVSLQVLWVIILRRDPTLSDVEAKVEVPRQEGLERTDAVLVGKETCELLERERPLDTFRPGEGTHPRLGTRKNTTHQGHIHRCHEATRSEVRR